MMIRNGDFGELNGIEYEVFENDDNTIDIATKDPDAIKRGFTKYQGQDAYYKTINPRELDKFYRIYTKGKIGHEIVNISREKENIVLIGTNDARIARDLGIGRTDKYYYEKWVLKNEVEIFEERKEMKL